MKHYKKLLVVSAIGLIVSASAVFSLAYKTDGSKLRNDITTAQTSITVVETQWDALPDANKNGIKDVAEEIVQGKVITKDPAVLNESTLDMYCFLEVTIPAKNVMVVENAPRRARTDLFSYTVKSGWTELKRTTSTTETKILYGYNTVVKPNNKTGTLFDSVKYANVVEGEISSGTVLNLNVQGYAIQAKTFTSMQDAYNNFDWNQSYMNGGS